MSNGCSVGAVTNLETNSTGHKGNDVRESSNIALNMSKDMVKAAGFNVEAPIVNALIANLTGALPIKKPEYKCDLCDCEVSSKTAFNIHIEGFKHIKRVRALDIIENLKQKNKEEVLIMDNEDPNQYRCQICFLSLNSPQQLKCHLSGLKHKKKAKKAGLIIPELTKDNRDDQGMKPPPAKRQKTHVENCVSNTHKSTNKEYVQGFPSKKSTYKRNTRTTKGLY